MTVQPFRHGVAYVALFISGLQPLVARSPTTPILSESFEGSPPTLQSFHATYSILAGPAHSGSKSLLLEPNSGQSGSVYFKLSPDVSPQRSYRFSATVRLAEEGLASLYISAASGGTRRQLAAAKGARAKNGSWTLIAGIIHPEDWGESHNDVRLALFATVPAYFDDVAIEEIEESPQRIVSWPKSLAQLHEVADHMAHPLSRGRQLELSPSGGALSLDLDNEAAVTPDNSDVEIPADGALVYTFDLAEPAVVSGKITLQHRGNLRPGLRAYVLIDSTLVAAPMVHAAPWNNIDGVLKNPAPELAGAPPSSEVTLTGCTLPAGRHRLMIAGPHSRPAGVLSACILKAEAAGPAPLYTFGFLADTHLDATREEWMNEKLTGEVAGQLRSTLAELRHEAVAFVILGGDMVDHGTAEEYSLLRDIVRESGVEVFGVLGNHDTVRLTSRDDVMRYDADLFPGGKTYYTVVKPPLRFVMLDKAYWRSESGAISPCRVPGKFIANTISPEQVDWLQSILRADPQTPTLVISHFQFFGDAGPASSGYEVASWPIHDASTDLMAKAPNVFATLNGHTHWSQVGQAGRITWLQNAAFVEWPAMYRVFRVYSDHLEWETRLVSNLGFLRESILPAKGLTWMISTSPADLAGSIPFPSAPAAPSTR